MEENLCQKPMHYGVCKLPANHDGSHSRLMPVNLTLKELGRADGGYTVVVRPNRSKGGWNVMIVRVATRRPVFQTRHVESKDQIPKEIASDLRMLNKCGSDSNMADASRTRNFRKP